MNVPHNPHSLSITSSSIFIEKLTPALEISNNARMELSISSSEFKGKIKRDGKFSVSMSGTTIRLIISKKRATFAARF